MELIACIDRNSKIVNIVNSQRMILILTYFLELNQ